MKESCEETPINVAPLPFPARRRSSIFCIAGSPQSENTNPASPEDAETKKQYLEYIEKIKKEKGEWLCLLRKHVAEDNRKKASNDELEVSLLNDWQLTFVRNKPNISEFIINTIEVSKNLDNFISRKNDLISRRDFIVDKADYMIQNKIAEITLEHIYLS